jgi:integrase
VKAGFTQRNLRFLPEKALSGYPDGQNWLALTVDFTSEEAKAILSRLTGTPYLVASLLYGAGLRLSEALRLRVQDLDFGMEQITVRDGKGRKDRCAMLPQIHMSWFCRRLNHRGAEAGQHGQPGVFAGCRQHFLFDGGAVNELRLFEQEHDVVEVFLASGVVFEDDEPCGKHEAEAVGQRDGFLQGGAVIGLPFESEARYQLV